MHTRLTIVLCLLAGIAQVPARAQEVAGLVSATTIGTEETVTYTLEVTGADLQSVANLQPPEADGLSLLSPTPSQQTSISIVNGSVSRSIGFRWRFRPEREGQVQFGAARVEIAGSTYETEAVSITVVPQSQRPQRRPRSVFSPFNFFDDPEPTPPADITDRDIFIDARASAREAFQNEQVTISYDLYFKSGLSPRNSRLADSWDAEGFWREDLEVTDRAVPTMTVLDGTRYNVVTLKRVAVFATRSGDLAVDPLQIATEVIPPAGSPFDRSLYSLAYTPIERASPTISIVSKPLPPDAPPGFAGAVGDYELTAQLSTAAVEIGEPVQLDVTIRGTGNIALLEAPVIEPPGIFEVYDPEVRTAIADEGSVIRGSKVYTWLLVPRSNGLFEIPPVRFIYFDPTRARYVTDEVVLPVVEVTGSAIGSIAVSATASGFPVDDIAPQLRTPNWTATGSAPFHRRAWFYVLIALPILGLAGVVIARRRAVRLATDTRWARNRTAHPLARKHLKQASGLLNAGQPIVFYEYLDRAVMSFVGNRMNLAELGLTRPQLSHELSNAGVDRGVIEELLEFLDACDAARFAAQRPNLEQMDHDLAQARRLLSTVAVELEAIIT